MPEGDTVFLAATRMHTALAGRELLATEFRVPRPVRAPRDATYNLVARQS